MDFAKYDIVAWWPCAIHSLNSAACASSRLLAPRRATPSSAATRSSSGHTSESFTAGRTRSASKAFQDRSEQALGHAHRAERLHFLHRAVVVGAAGDELPAEAGHVRVALRPPRVDLRMEDLDRVDAGIEQARHELLVIRVERRMGDRCQPADGVHERDCL